MVDWGLIAIRFALYTDLMLLVGLSAFPLYSFTRAEREARNVLSLSALLAWLAFAGVLFSIAGFVIATAAMMGVPLNALNTAVLEPMVTESAIGIALIVRIAALTVVLVGCLLLRRNETVRFAATFLSGAVALATLSWSGHAGATEGALGTVHRISDIAHMVAAALWLGAITSFCFLLSSRTDAQNTAQVAMVARTLANFSAVGTVAIAIIVITGLFNGFVISGVDIVSLPRSTYGKLLMAKVVLFGLMLSLAGHNRWRLTPALARSVDGNDVSAGWHRLRISLGMEAGVGGTVLILVAWLGTLSPS